MSLALRETIEGTLPPHAHENVDLDGLFELMAEDRNGHAFQAGWHFGWAWSGVGDCVDFLSEHRMTEITADTFEIAPSDGAVGLVPIDTPTGMRRASEDPLEDARLDAAHTAQSRVIYDRLRSRGLLPPLGENMASQDMNELLITDRLES